MADIEHSALPDELLHEPKGASTAAEGMIYIADGQGSGGFGFVPVSSLDLEKAIIAKLVSNTFTDSTSIDSSKLTQGVTQELEEIVTDILPPSVLNDINKNTAEFAALYNNVVTILSQLKTETINLKSKVNEILTALKNEGFIDE